MFVEKLCAELSWSSAAPSDNGLCQPPVDLLNDADLSPQRSAHVVDETLVKLHSNSNSLLLTNLQAMFTEDELVSYKKR